MKSLLQFTQKCPRLKFSKSKSNTKGKVTNSGTNTKVLPQGIHIPNIEVLPPEALKKVKNFGSKRKVLPQGIYIYQI
jgi:hypothetical protein